MFQKVADLFWDGLAAVQWKLSILGRFVFDRKRRKAWRPSLRLIHFRKGLGDSVLFVMGDGNMDISQIQ